MGLSVKNLIPFVEPATDIVTGVADNVARVKISNNELKMRQSDNALAAYQTASNNQVTKFMGILNNVTNIATALISLANAGIQAYAQIEESHEQTRRVQIQADAYISGKREETRQVQIQQEQETVRYLTSLKKDLDMKRLELQKFEQELAERRETRNITQEQWQRKIDYLEEITRPMFEYAKELRKRYLESDFADDKCRDELNHVDEIISAYFVNMNELYK